MATIQGVYVALFGRPADPFGLEYWKGVTNDGANLSAIGDLAQTQEYQDRFAGQSNAQVVNSIFQSLFNRSADVAGLTYWVNGLNSGEFTINDVAIRILDGAQGSDKDTVELKVAAADAFTASLDTAEEIVAYDGNAAAAAGRAFLTGVTTEAPTQAQIDAAIADITDNPPANGETFTLSASATVPDTLVGTDRDDVFNAPAGTLQNGDTLVGNGGYDTLNATLVAGGAAIQPNLDAIERINITANAAGGSIDLATSTGVQDVTFAGTAAAGIANAASSSLKSVSLNGYTNTATVGVNNFNGTGASAETLAVNLNGTGAASGLTLSGAGLLENLNIASNGASANTLTLSAAAVQGGVNGSKVAVTGSAALELRGAAAQYNGLNLDASAATGAVSLRLDVDGLANAVASVNAASFKGVNTYTVVDSAAGTANGVNLFNIATGSTVNFGADLNASTITVAGAASATDDVINLNLKTVASTAADVDVAGLTIANVETININSTGAPTTGSAADQQNSIGTLTANAATTINLTGDSAFGFTLASTNDKSVTIDGSDATGALTIFAPVAVNATAAQTVTINGGAGNDFISADGAGVGVKFVLTGGAGNDTFALTIGSTNDMITDFTAGDKIQLGAGAVDGAFVNALALSAGDQASLEGAASVDLAIAALSTALGGIAVDTAVAFSYQGNQYIFLNEATANAFDAASDVIVQVSGLSSTSDFAAGTFLFAA